MLKQKSKNLRHKGGQDFIFRHLPLAISLFLFIFCLLNANSAFAGSAALAWNAPTERVDGTLISSSDIKGYNIHYGTASGNYTQTQPITGNVTTYTFTNLPNGVNYYFAVSAIDTTDKESGYSTELCKTIGTTTITCSTGGDTQTPTVPAGLSGQAISSSQINLSWTASTDNIGVTGYRIYRNGALIGTSTITSYSNTGLSASTTYTYTVSAYDAAGNASSQSASASATTLNSGDTQSPTVPAGLSAQAISSSQINLSWTASTDNVGVTGYRIYRNGALIGTSAITSYSNTGLSASTTYTYAVSAYDAAGNVSSQSAPASATTLSGGGGGDTQAPTVPAGISLQAISTSEIILSWTASTDNVGVTGYSIYRDGTLINTSATNSYSDSGLSASTAYTYTVSAYDAAGNASSQSSPISATTLGISSIGDNSNNLSTNSTGGDSEITGGGCGFVKDDNGKGPRAKGQGLSFAMMLIMTLAGIAAARRVPLLRKSTAYKPF